MEGRSVPSTIRRIAFIGNYMPRQCGIATFTTDLCEAVAAAYPKATCIALPVNDTAAGYDYPARVRFELTEKDIESYRRAADFLNINNVDLVCLQFEYGIFGGRAGSHILALLRELRMPVVTTLHTILNEPDPDQRRVLEQVAALSARLVVMSGRGAEFLRTIYHVPADKIDLIPHGIPDVPFVDPSFNKDLFGVEGKIVLLSFGLLSANKGIENVISALPAVVARYPDVVYIVVGATHPHVIQNEGETYRLSLQWLAQEKGVESHVIFYNRFVSLEELVEFIGAADIYITPYLNVAADHVGHPGIHARRGQGRDLDAVLVRGGAAGRGPGHAGAVPRSGRAGRTDDLPAGQRSQAPRHAQAGLPVRPGHDLAAGGPPLHGELRTRPRGTPALHPPGFTVKALDKHPGELPPLRLDHLRRMTDETGILQHAIFTVPNYREGLHHRRQCPGPDGERAPRSAGHQRGLRPGLPLPRLPLVRLQYRDRALPQLHGLPAQLAGGQRLGRQPRPGTVGAGHGVGPLNSPALHSMAGWLFEQALPTILETTSPRAWAFALLGIHEYLRRFCRRPRGRARFARNWPGDC